MSAYRPRTLVLKSAGSPRRAVQRRRKLLPSPARRSLPLDVLPTVVIPATLAAKLSTSPEPALPTTTSAPA